MINEKMPYENKVSTLEKNRHKFNAIPRSNTYAGGPGPLLPPPALLPPEIIYTVNRNQILKLTKYTLNKVRPGQVRSGDGGSKSYFCERRVSKHKVKQPRLIKRWDLSQRS